MKGLRKKRLQEGALRARKTPQVLPPPARLVSVEQQLPLKEGEGTWPAPEEQAAPVGKRPADLNPEVVQRAVTQAQAGDLEGLNLLYVRYAGDVLRYVTSIVRDSQEAEDITQNVFAKLATAILKYEPREVPFAAWIMRVARNAALDHLRARRAIPTTEGEGTLVNIPDAGINFDRGLALRQALEQLPDDQREVLVLRYIAGLTPTEIAATTERSESSVHGLHHRGRRALQAYERDLHEMLAE